MMTSSPDIFMKICNSIDNNNNNNSNISMIDFQSQLWNLMSLHLQLQKTSTPSTSTETAKNPTPAPSFSIDTILNFPASNINEHVASKQHTLLEKLSESEEDVVTSSSPSPTCSSTSFTLDSLQNTDRRRLNKKTSAHRYVCDKCGKNYATTSNLSRHKQTHRALDSPHAKQCPHCDRVYVSMPALSMHILTHNASHECHVCGKRFSRLWLLQGHLRSHSGLRPFSCAHCGKSFADRSNLRAHMLTHSGDKNFECSKCSRRFALRAYLNRHSETCK